MKQKTQEIITAYYEGMENTHPLKIVFEDVLIKYLEFHNTPTDLITMGDDSLFCSIHNNFSVGHNCVGCNLNSSNSRIENFLLGYRFFKDEHHTFTSFIFLLYLQVEQIFEYFEIIKLPESYKQKHFSVLYDVKRWANFLKHPKTFLLVHHPNWTYEGEEDFVTNGITPVINTKFVNEYYSGDRKNHELSKKLYNKENIEVQFPNPLTLIDRFCIAQEKFVLLIKENQIVREILNDEASILDYFDSLPDDDIIETED